MRGFLLKHGAQDSDVDDLVQNVFAKLVGILREGKYEKCRGRFRAYLSTLLYHELIGSVGAGTNGRHLRGGRRATGTFGGFSTSGQVSRVAHGRVS